MGIALLIPPHLPLSRARHRQDDRLLCGRHGRRRGAGGAAEYPRHSSAVVTYLDGHPMAQLGKGASALGWAVFASGAGSLISWWCWSSPLRLWLPSAPVFPLRSMPLWRCSADHHRAVSGKNLAKGIIAAAWAWPCPLWAWTHLGRAAFHLPQRQPHERDQLLPAMIGFYSIPEISPAWRRMRARRRAGRSTI
jgi:hypothetical protein